MSRNFHALWLDGKNEIDHELDHNGKEYKRRAFLSNFLRRHIEKSNLFVTGIPLGDFDDTLSFVNCVAKEFNLSNEDGKYVYNDRQGKRRKRNHFIDVAPSVSYDTQSQAKIGIQVVNAKFYYNEGILPIEIHFHIEDAGDVKKLFKNGEVAKYTMYYCLSTSRDSIRNEKKITYNPRVMKKID